MHKGVIDRLVIDRGFGFIISEDDSQKYFFHYSNVMAGAFNTLRQDDEVTFSLAPSTTQPGKMQAVDVTLTNLGIISRLPPTKVSSRPGTHSAQDNAGVNSKSPLLPYGFVPINIESAITDTPVWHDGSRPDDKELDSGLLSGELRCTLTALTPLLPGNTRYPIRKDGDPKKEFVADPALLKQWGFGNSKPSKQIAEPLRLADGSVVIPGTALKGMVRHSLGALLSAPMERVEERHYTYRPNLDFNQQAQETLMVRPALVRAIKNDGWETEVFGHAKAALFVRQEVEGLIRAASVNGKVSGVLRGVEREINRNNKLTNHLIESSGSWNCSSAMRLVNYRGGIDGQGLLAAAFNKKDAWGHSRLGTYNLALVPATSDVTLEIPGSLYKRYLDEQSDVLANNKIGHLTKGHPLEFNADSVASAINDSRAFSPGQLIYVELTTDSDGKVTSNSRVVSCGHHFRYRWAFTSSVHRKNGKIRDCLTPLPSEQKTVSTEGALKGSPERLTGPRLLFGYVRDKNNPIGEKSFERLAGRIAINHAVTHGEPRFLGDPEKGYCVPLPILGQPKSSAWEFYLRQDSVTTPSTYGDLPENEGGDLAGRKFYRHQPMVQSITDIAATDSETILSDQATLARYICAPGTEFRFAIRFSRLRPWELGALMVTLQPHRLLKNGIPSDYAHKLGLGRPLGMGSVRLNIDTSVFRSTGQNPLQTDIDAEDVIAKAINALGTRILRDAKLKSQLCLWMDIHSFKDSGRLDYPRDDRKNTIFDWHTDRRREYSKLRRQARPAWESFCNTINERMKFPAYHTENDFIDVSKTIDRKLGC